MWFLYKIFGRWNDQVRFFLIGCMILHFLINITMVLEIVLQCGPNPYRLSNRLSYFHYSWDGPAGDGSVICRPEIVATSGVGFLSGGKQHELRKSFAANRSQPLMHSLTLPLRLLRATSFGNTRSCR